MGFMGALLGLAGGYAGCRGQQEEGQLLHDQAAEPQPPMIEVQRVPAAQRPVIQEQQDKRGGDQHRLGEQPEGEGAQGQPVRQQGRARGTGFFRRSRLRVSAPGARIAFISKQGEKEEEGAQHVFAFGYPGH